MTKTAVRAALLILLTSAAFATPEADNLAQQGAHAYWNKKYDLAFKHFKKACELGNGDGCAYLGMAYEDGISVKKEREKAISFYQKACKLGSKQSCENYKKLQK